jgi:ribosomal protein S12 methylthiotransferase accessory factor
MTNIKGKDNTAENTIKIFAETLSELGLDLEFTQILNPLKNVFSVILQDKNFPHIQTNGKGTTLEAAKASAYGEMAERLLNQSFFEDYYLGKNVSKGEFVRYPDEKWFPLTKKQIRYLNTHSYKDIPDKVLKEDLSWNKPPFKSLFPSEYRKNMQNAFTASFPLIDMVSANTSRGICAIPLKNETSEKGETVYFPIRFLEITHFSNGLCAGNSEYEAKVQGLSELFERYVRRICYGGKSRDMYQFYKHIKSPLGTLPDITSFPAYTHEFITNNYPTCAEIIKELNTKGYNVRCYDCSCGGLFPVVAIYLAPINSTKFKLSIASHPITEIALERTLTECFQGAELNNLTFSEYNVDDLISNQKHKEDKFEQFLLTKMAPPELKKALRESYKFLSPDWSPKNEDNFYANYVSGDGVLDSRFFTQKPYFEAVEWSCDKNSTTKEQYEFLLEKLRNLKLDLYSYDASYKDLKAYRLFVPYFSEIIQPSENNLSADAYDVQIAKKIHKIANMSPNKIVDFIYDYIYDARFEGRIINYRAGILDSDENPYKDVTTDHLQSLFSTTYSHTEDIADAVIESQPSTSLSTHYINTYLILSQLDYFDPDTQKQMIATAELTSSEEILQKCYENIKNKTPFKFFPDLGDNFENYPPQQRLIKLYKLILSKKLMEKI